MHNFIRKYPKSVTASASAVAVTTTFLINSSIFYPDGTHENYTHCDEKPSTHRQKQHKLVGKAGSKLDQLQNFNKNSLALSDSSNETSSPRAKLLFLGSGSSTGCPKPLCSLLFPPSKNGTEVDPQLETLRKISEKNCRTSIMASQGDPRYNKNYRGNPSLVISHFNDDDSSSSSSSSDSHLEIDTDKAAGRRRNVIIDVGKTFRENAIRFLPLNSIYHIDGIVLTHEHMDAIGGLDDVRGVQLPQIRHHHSKNNMSNYMIPRKPIPVYLSSDCYKAIQKQFFYLVPRVPKEGEVKRAVAALTYHEIKHFQPFVAGGLKMIPLPIMHGEDFVSNGYAFTVRGPSGTKGGKKNKMNVIYLSDISRMLPETLQYIQENLAQPTDVLIVDSLNMDRSHPVHFSLREALDLAKILKPKRTFIVGVNCDDFLPHDEMNEELAKLDMDVQLAYDGLVLYV